MTVAVGLAGSNDPVVEVEGLKAVLDGSGATIIDEVSLHIRAGEMLGLVGESGSGKSTTALTLLGHARRGVRIVEGRVRVAGIELLTEKPRTLRALRGRVVSYVPQDPSAALHPGIRIGRQLRETLDVHEFGSSSQEREQRMREMLEEVLLPSDHAFLASYPHQLSGGQKQRIALAMAFACRPRAIVLDEPTTGLDVTTQAHVLETVRKLCREHLVAALYVTHDLAVVANLADRVAVMYAGRIVESAETAAVFRAAKHPYTTALIEASPGVLGARELGGIPGSVERIGERPPGCSFAARCSYALEACAESAPPQVSLADEHVVRCFRYVEVRSPAYAQGQESDLELDDSHLAGAAPLIVASGITASYGDREVLHGVSIDCREAECVALVGESGSGKTTLARCVAGLHSAYVGEITLRGERLASRARDRATGTRREVQYIYQSPYKALNPRRTIGQTLARPLRLFFDLNGAQTRARIAEALEAVGLRASVADNYPSHLSGGERQRVAIARALISEPRVLVCDEVTSALDVSVQASIITLLRELQSEMGIALLFVTHNLELVRSIADRVAVMSGGTIVEQGPTSQVLAHPEANYTKALLADTPTLSGAQW